MFNKNPIFDRMDIGHMATENTDSEYSMGNASHLTRNVNPLADKYSTMIPEDANNFDKRSMLSAAMVRSLSSKRLRPIGSAIQKAIDGARMEK